MNTSTNTETIRTNRLTGILSLYLGTFYSFGFGPINSQATTGIGKSLFYALFLGAVFLLIRSQRKISRFEKFLFAGIALALPPYTLYSNALVHSISDLTLFFGLTLFIISHWQRGEVAATAHSYIVSLLLMPGVILGQLFSPQLWLNIPHLFLKSSAQPDKTPPKTRRTTLFWGMIASAPVLLVFHLLFAQINVEYKKFSREITQFIHDILTYLLDVTLILCLIESVIRALLFCALFSVRMAKVPSHVSELSLKQIIHIVITLTILLFALFSYFQSRLLFVQISSMDFKTLSLYTQRGFWELLMVALIGYVLLHFSIRQRSPHPDSETRWRNMLLIYSAELLLISAFTLHKLYALQFGFGLKDQRIFACAGVVLIIHSFILSILYILNRTSITCIFRQQISAYLIIAGTLGLMNVDRFITVVHPTSFRIGETPHKDYSYLLGNSYDNSGSWKMLVQQAMSEGLAYPENYYWGRYSPLCYRGAPYRTSYLERKFNTLRDKYQTDLAVDIQSLRDLLTFNLSEIRAYLLLSRERALFDDFFKFVPTQC